MPTSEYDVLVVGGGPGGLASAIFCAERGLRVAIFEGGALGGLMASLYPEKVVTNYLGFPEGIKASELTARLVKQAEEYDVEIVRERALEITREKVVRTEEAEYHGKRVVIATGVRPRELGIPGEVEFADRGVSYYATDPSRFKDKRVLVVGGGDSAVEAALKLAGVARSVAIVHRRDRFRTHGRNVEAIDREGIHVLLNTELEEMRGDEAVERAVLVDNARGERSELEVDEVVLAVGMVPNTEIFQKLGLETDGEGRIITDAEQRTNVDGIYGVGDTTSGAGSLELIEVAMAQGAIAAHHIYLELAEPY